MHVTGEHPIIVISHVGAVTQHDVDFILTIMKGCYRHLEPHKTDLVDLYVFQKASSMKAFMMNESAAVGVNTGSFDELFFAVHDAYRGTSRILFCLEMMKKLPKLVQIGGIRHEVGHSVLHGSLFYYFVPLPTILIDSLNRLQVSRTYALNLLYLLSIAVKDYEVTRLLYKRGYIEDQKAYVKHLLTDTENDKLVWNISRKSPLTELLFLVSCLKTGGCAAPFLVDENSDVEIQRLLADSLSYLPSPVSASLIKVIRESFSSLGADTLSNVNSFTNFVVENLITPLFTR